MDPNFNKLFTCLCDCFLSFSSKSILCNESRSKPPESDSLIRIQVDYAPKLLEKGLHSTIKQANEDIKQMNADISGYMAPYVSIKSKHTYSGCVLCIGKLLNNRALEKVQSLCRVENSQLGAYCYHGPQPSQV